MVLEASLKAAFNYDNFRARLKNAIRSLQIDWLEFCKRADLPPMGALQAIEGCRYELERYLEELCKIAEVLGRDLQWLLTGVSAESSFTIGIREQAHTLVDEFVYRAQVPSDDAPRLHAYVDRMIDSMQVHTAEAAYRRGLPGTWRDVASIYEELQRMNG